MSAEQGRSAPQQVLPAAYSRGAHIAGDWAHTLLAGVTIRLPPHETRQPFSPRNNSSNANLIDSCTTQRLVSSSQADTGTSVVHPRGSVSVLAGKPSSPLELPQLDT